MVFVVVLVLPVSLLFKYFSNKWNVVFSVKYSPRWLLWNELVNSNMEIYLMMLGECSYIQTQASTTPRLAHVECTEIWPNDNTEQNHWRDSQLKTFSMVDFPCGEKTARSSEDCQPYLCRESL